MPNKVDQILNDAFTIVDRLAHDGDVHVAAKLRCALETLADAIEEERKLPPRNAAKMYEEICEISKDLDRPDALRLIRGHVYAALRSRPRVCDVNSLESLSDFVVKTFRGHKLCNDLPEPIKAMIDAGIRAAIEIAYDPASL